jgi:hypothetical protein
MNRQLRCNSRADRERIVTPSAHVATRRVGSAKCYQIREFDRCRVPENAVSGPQHRRVRTPIGGPAYRALRLGALARSPHRTPIFTVPDAAESYGGNCALRGSNASAVIVVRGLLALELSVNDDTQLGQASKGSLELAPATVACL